MSPRPARSTTLLRRAARAVGWLLVAASPALPQAPPGVAEEPDSRCSFADLLARDTLFGFEARRRGWRERGVDVDAFYNAFVGWNARGGANTTAARRYSHSFDLFVRADTGRMGLWPGGSALLQVKNNWDENINPDVGSLSQAVDDADFTENVYIDQLYYEHAWREGAARLRMGYLDYQTIIDRNAYANSEDVRFMSAALDNNLLVPLKIGFGAALFLDPVEWLRLIIGTADAENDIRNAGWDTAFEDTDGLMAYGEATVTTEFDGALGTLPGHYRFGVFYDPRPRPVYDEMRTKAGTVGTWLSLDQLIYSESGGDGQGLGVFYRYGYREEESYAVSESHSAGLEYTGPLPRRDADAFGIGFYDLVASDDFQDFVTPGFGGETGYESYYRIRVSPWLAVTPGIQYITNPGGLDSSSDAVAFVLRTRMKL